MGDEGDYKAGFHGLRHGRSDRTVQGSLIKGNRSKKEQRTSEKITENMS